jgi:hypothetical protein
MVVVRKRKNEAARLSDHVLPERLCAVKRL